MLNNEHGLNVTHAGRGSNGGTAIRVMATANRMTVNRVGMPGQARALLNMAVVVPPEHRAAREQRCDECDLSEVGGGPDHRLDTRCR